MGKIKKSNRNPQPFGDWESGEGYPGPNDPHGYWMWEFLRRNPEYWEDWEIFSKEDVRRTETAARRDALVCFYKDGQTQDLAVGKWGISYMADPRKKEPMDPFGRHITFLDSPMIFTLGEEAWSKKHRKVLKGINALKVNEYFEYPLLFDLRQPIDPLIKLANKILVQRKKLLVKESKIEPRDKRFYPKRFPFYLRILDARSNAPAIPYKKIAEILSRDIEAIGQESLSERNVIDWFKAAKRIRNYDYRFIHKS